MSKGLFSDLWKRAFPTSAGLASFSKKTAPDVEAPDVGHRHLMVLKKKNLKEMLEMLMCLELACAHHSPAAVGEAPAESAPYNIKSAEEG